jgi:FkbM family methyltransferase
MITHRPLRRIFGQIRRRCCELVGIDRYSRPALNGLDRKLERYLDFDGGYFVEAGANDGFTQSNTYYFERLRGWRGVLIEPVPGLVAKCRAIRSRSNIFEAALVPFDYPQASIVMDYSDLTSSVVGAFGDEARRSLHQAHGLKIQHLDKSYQLEVPTRTLTSILQEAGAPYDFDLLSLDVEGYEAMVLRGLDFTVYRPRYLLIEVRDHAGIEACLGDHYEKETVLAETASYQDVLYVRRNS